ncbi:50S ribosomal protein L2 [Candidatus Woesearchaeota archaeon]|nr:50S ribosomal protein L2 [Candidatus Woesearchaeota archaeon]
MGKTLLQQARGKGSLTYKSPGHRFLGSVKHAKLTNTQLVGKVMDIVHCPGHYAPLAQVRYQNGETSYMLAPEGIRVGDEVMTGQNAPINPGNTVPLKDVPEGTLVYNIESQPGDGGKFCRSAGTFSRVISHTVAGVLVELPSKKTKMFLPECRVGIGILAAGGRQEKPFLKAGRKHYAFKARNRMYPTVSGVSQNAVDHPFGGKSSHVKGRPTQSARNDPPGRKVGKIAPSRTGRR